MTERAGEDVTESDVQTPDTSGVVHPQPPKGGPPPTPPNVIDRWGAKSVVCFHGSHNGWAWHHEDYRHGGIEQPYMIRLVPPSADEVREAIDDCRRLVMAMYGGNLDHPALDHLEAAMAEVIDTDRRLSA
jgi:hypothetical protein